MQEIITLPSQSVLNMDVKKQPTHHHHPPASCTCRFSAGYHRVALEAPFLYMPRMAHEFSWWPQTNLQQANSPDPVAIALTSVRYYVQGHQSLWLPTTG